MRKIRDVLRLRAGGLDPCLVELVRYLARWAAERDNEAFSEQDRLPGDEPR
jgi:hypothetical protein